MARKQRAEQWAEHRRQRDEAERRQRVMVITESTPEGFRIKEADRWTTMSDLFLAQSKRDE